MDIEHANPKYTAIWQVVAAIPAGTVTSYGVVAAQAGLPRAARLVGTALKAAPRELMLPWHRVMNASGKIAFDRNSCQFKAQRDRLQSEGVLVVDGKVRFKQFAWQPDRIADGIADGKTTAAHEPSLDELLWGPPPKDNDAQ